MGGAICWRRPWLWRRTRHARERRSPSGSPEREDGRTLDTFILRLDMSIPRLDTARAGGVDRWVNRLAEPIGYPRRSMASVDPLGPLIRRLREARDFEAAANQTLVAMLAVAGDQLARNPAASGRLLRGELHLRPNDSYQRLFGVEHPHGEHVEGTGYLTSANVWRWVSEHRTAVSINVKTGTLRTWFAEGASEPEPLRDSGSRARRRATA
jgi:hypothetical protein